MATKPRMPPAGMMNRNPQDDGSGAGAGAQAQAQPMGPGPAPQPMPGQQMQQEDQGDQLYTEDEMKEHGLKCAVLSKWDTVLRMLYWEKYSDPKQQVIANTLFEIMVHFGFENPPEQGDQQETA